MNKLIGEDSLSVLEKSADGVGDLLHRYIGKLSNRVSPVSYSPQIRSFALTLHFYSPHAYNYVRKMFNTCLPHPRTIEKWYRSVDGKPGFTYDSVRALQARASAMLLTGKRMVCALVMDEIAILQQVEWDGKVYHGYINMGSELDDDSLPIAKEALMFMVVGINDSFKLPVGYFLIDGLGGVERSNLVQQCLSQLHNVGVDVVSLTFDGAASNIAMVKSLGCELDCCSAQFKTHFKHPITECPVSVFFDPCHMLKLIRNTLGDKGSIVDDRNEFIKWDYVKKLHDLQDCEGLHLGNKLRHAHIAFYKKKMNVKLAAQILSESVACSLEFCLKEKLPGFEGCEATIKFIRLFNNLFDMLNSRNLKAFGFHSPMQAATENEFRAFLCQSKMYIAALKESRNGRLLVNSSRKTGFLGFIICIDSLLVLYERLMASSQYHMSFLCTFKISQDHLELFFGKIRRLSGCNNNPSARQFCSAYKRLLVQNEVQDTVRGNCLPLELIPILSVSSSDFSSLNYETPATSELNGSVSRSRILNPDEISMIASDNDYIYIPTRSHLSLCGQKIVAYIAGFVVFKLKTLLHCETCISSLTADSNNPLLSLTTIKNRGGLVFPSDDVIDVCLTCEKFFRLNVSKYTGSNFTLSQVKCHSIVQAVLSSYIYKRIFVNLSDHMLQCDALTNHVVLLIKAIAEKYLQVRYYYAGKFYNAKLKESKVKISRQVYTKLIIFSGQ